MAVQRVLIPTTGQSAGARQVAGIMADGSYPGTAFGFRGFLLSSLSGFYLYTETSLKSLFLTNSQNAPLVESFSSEIPIPRLSQKRGKFVGTMRIFGWRIGIFIKCRRNTSHYGKTCVPRPLASISEKVMKSVWAVLEKVLELK